MRLFLLICWNVKRDASPISAPLLANSDEHFRGEELDHHIPAPAGCYWSLHEEEVIAIYYATHPEKLFPLRSSCPFWKRGPKMDMDKKVTWKFLFGILFSSTKLGNRTHNIFHALQVEYPHLFTGVTNAQLMSGKSSVMRLLIAGRATKITLYDLSHWFGYNVLGTQCRKWESSAVR